MAWLAALGAAECAWAFNPESKPAGVGIVVGEPTGVSAKYWVRAPEALQGGLSYSVRREFLQVHADYLWHYHDLLGRRRQREAAPDPQSLSRLVLYAGAGGRLGMKENEAEFGVRVPIGVSYLFRRAPIDLFLEIVPGISLLPDTSFELQGGLGGRYYF